MTTEQLATYYTRKAARMNKRAVELEALGDATSAENMRHYARKLLAKIGGPRQTVAEVMNTGVVLCDHCGQPHSGNMGLCYRCRPVIGDYNHNPRD